MPLFEYQCNDCAKSFEVLVLSGSSKTQIACPACQSQEVRKKLSTFASKSSSSAGSFSLNTAPSSCSTGGG